MLLSVMIWVENLSIIERKRYKVKDWNVNSSLRIPLHIHTPDTFTLAWPLNISPVRDSIRYGCNILVDIRLKEAAKYYFLFFLLNSVCWRKIIIFCKQDAVPPLTFHFKHLISWEMLSKMGPVLCYIQFGKFKLAIKANLIAFELNKRAKLSDF